MSARPEVSATRARPTTTGVDGGYDVDISVFFRGRQLPAGEVTLVPGEPHDHNAPRRWSAWGSPEQWVSGAMLAAIDPDDMREVLDAVERAAADEIARCTYAFAAIGDDGVRPVVWGLGDTPEAALLDAREQDGIDAGADLHVMPITRDQQAAIRCGDVDASGLMRQDGA